MRKRKSIAQRVIAILAVVLILHFAGGCVVLYELEKANTNYIYQITGELSHASILKMEDQMAGIQDILYDIVVSPQVQEAGSTILAESAAGAVSTMKYSSSMNVITSRIQQGIVSDHAIVCANFLDETGQVRVVASTRYYRPSEEVVMQIGSLATQEQGKTLLLDGWEATGDTNILILAKEVREKKDLSLEHIGVIILYVDMEQVCRPLTDVHNGMLVLSGQNSTLRYILNDSQDILAQYMLDFGGNGYAIRHIGRDRYFVVHFSRPGQMFSYTLLEPYTHLFRDVEIGRAHV